MDSPGDFATFLLQSFLLILVAMDAIGTLPFLLSLTRNMTPSERRRVTRISILTAAVLGFVFLFVGNWVLSVLSIQKGDFAVAGGLILLSLSVVYLVTGKLVDELVKDEMVAVVPIGTPLLVGPATLTAILLQVTNYHQEHSMASSVGIVSLAFVINLLAAWLVFAQSQRIADFLGEGGLRAVSRIASLLLAAIAVKMIRDGIILIIEDMPNH
jgi:multiple antibiotic resistance protein